MSLAAMKFVMDQDIRPPAAKLVAIALAWHMGGNNSCWPSQAALAREVGITDRQVRKHIAALEAKGVIARRRRYGTQGYRIADKYILVGLTDAETSGDS